MWSVAATSERPAGGAAERLAGRLAEAVAGQLVGRARERTALATAITATDGPAVVFLHGPGGIGKSALLHGTIAATGVRAVVVDGRDVEPTPAGLIAAIADGVGARPEALDGPGELTGRLTSAGIEVVAIDGYEHLGIVDGWIRNELLPALPADLHTVLCGRNPPNAAWRTAPGWSRLFTDQLLGPLAADDAASLLARHDLTRDQTERALRFGRGHPLALELAAAAMRRRPDLDLRGGPPPEVVEELIEVIHAGLTADEQAVTEAVSVLRCVTEPLLAAVLDEGTSNDDAAGPDVGAAWRTLRSLPFTAVTRNGIELHPVVHDVIVGSLELRNPQRASELRRRAAVAAMAEVGHPPAWGPTADLLHLVQNPVVRDAFFPPHGFQHPVEVARADDRDAILATAERHDGVAGRAVIERWWDAHPEGFSVARGPDGGVRAFTVVVELGRLDRSRLAGDPLLAAVLADVEARPLAPSDRVLVNRRALSARHGDRVAVDLAPMLIDIKRTYLELRPDLARVYVVGTGWTQAAPMMSGLGFRQTGHEVRMGDARQYLAALDFGPGSVDAWLARLVAAEAAAPPPTRDGAVARLSPREREVLAALAEGLTNRELAERLFISERTANRHLSNIFTKLGVHNRTAAARLGIEAGLTG